MEGGAPDCPQVNQCAIVLDEESNDSVCLCSLSGVASNTPGGPGNPGPYPAWPGAPGFPDPDPWQWPEPPGGGTWPNLPPPGPGECDPHGITNSCFFTAHLKCPTNVTRGSSGACVLTVEPENALEFVRVWTFNGAPIHASYDQNTTTWSGVSCSRAT